MKPRLLQEYRSLCPGVRVLYVIPDIARFSKHNPYLEFLYAPVFAAARGTVQLQSSSFLNPAIVFRRIAGEKSVLHHHWFEFQNLRMLLNLLWKLFWAALYRLAGGKIVWTVHNRVPHAPKYRWLNRALRRLWAKIPHRIHVHCQTAIPLLVPVLGVPPDKFFVVPHPQYPARLVPPFRARQWFREHYPAVTLEQAVPVFMMFGYIAEYKGILEVMEIFSRQAAGQLIIAGALKQGNRGYLGALQKIERSAPNVHLIVAHIPEAHIPMFLGTADYLIFNYSDILESGGVMLGKSYHCRLIVPNRGCLRELSGKNVWKFDTGAELAQLIEKLVKVPAPSQKKTFPRSERGNSS